MLLHEFLIEETIDNAVFVNTYMVINASFHEDTFSLSFFKDSLLFNQFNEQRLKHYSTNLLSRFFKCFKTTVYLKENKIADCTLGPYTSNGHTYKK